MYIEKNWQAIYMQLGVLSNEMPPELFGTGPITSEMRMWLGKAYALIKQVENGADPHLFSSASDNLSGILRETNSNTIASIFFRNLAIAEANAPATVTGSFIPVGHQFDTYTAIGRIFSTAKGSIFIVDPYLDEQFLSRFALSAPEQIPFQLLFSNKEDVKLKLKPAIAAWKNQYKNLRPIEARTAPSKTLHDRVIIIDQKNVWSLTQSFALFAERSPATITKIESEIANMKIAAFGEIWNSGLPLEI